jgi:hypothetical protein
MTSQQLDKLQDERLRCLVQKERHNEVRFAEVTQRTEEVWNHDFGHCFPNLFAASISDSSDTE